MGLLLTVSTTGHDDVILGNKITSVFNEEDHILGGRGS